MNYLSNLLRRKGRLKRPSFRQLCLKEQGIDEGNCTLLNFTTSTLNMNHKVRHCHLLVDELVARRRVENNRLQNRQRSLHKNT